MTDIPAHYRLKIHKGTTFILKFAVRVDGTREDLANATLSFKAAGTQGGSAAINKSSADSPSAWSVDSESIATLTLTSSETAAITEHQLNYQIDVTMAGVKRRRLMGQIDIIEQVA